MLNIEKFNERVIDFQHKLDAIHHSDNLQEKLISLLALRDNIEDALNECSNNKHLLVQANICNDIKQSVNDLIADVHAFTKDPNLLEKIIADNSNPKEILNTSQVNLNSLNSMESNGAIVSLNNTNPSSEATAKTKTLLAKLKLYCKNNDQEQTNEEDAKPKSP